MKSKGVSDVAQLSGGIHRYLEEFPEGGHFKGKNFVFDQRVAVSSTNPTIVGRCLGCEEPFDEISGSRIWQRHDNTFHRNQPLTQAG